MHALPFYLVALLLASSQLTALDTNHHAQGALDRRQPHFLASVAPANASRSSLPPCNSSPFSASSHHLNATASLFSISGACNATVPSSSTIAAQVLRGAAVKPTKKPIAKPHRAAKATSTKRVTTSKKPSSTKKSTSTSKKPSSTKKSTSTSKKPSSTVKKPTTVTLSLPHPTTKKSSSSTKKPTSVKASAPASTKKPTSVKVSSTVKPTTTKASSTTAKPTSVKVSSTTSKPSSTKPLTTKSVSSSTSKSTSSTSKSASKPITTPSTKSSTPSSSTVKISSSASKPITTPSSELNTTPSSSKLSRSSSTSKASTSSSISKSSSSKPSSAVPSTAAPSSRPSNTSSIVSSTNRPSVASSSAIPSPPTTTTPPMMTSSEELITSDYYMTSGYNSSYSGSMNSSSSSWCGIVTQQLAQVYPASPWAPAPQLTAVPGCKNVRPATGDVPPVNVCTAARLCDPRPPQNNKMSLVTVQPGPLQRQEVETLLSLMQNTSMHLLNGYGNYLANGALGWTLISAGLVFEATGDIRFLDTVVRIADNILWARNDPITGRVMWDGVRELVWPTKFANWTNAGYAGCDGLHIIGHMATAANYVFKNPCLWDQIPQNSTQVSNLPWNATYLDHAVSWVNGGDESFDTYDGKWMFDSNGIMIAPNDTRYNAMNDIAAGNPMPWNRRSMMLDGLISLAVAHAIPNTPVFNLTRTNLYNSLADANVRNFVANMKPAKSPIDGSPTLTWSYSIVQPGGMEANAGIHLFYDIWGLFIAWQHGNAPDVLTDQLMSTIANMMQNAMWSNSTQTFAGMINGLSNTCDPNTIQTKWGWGSWMNYGRFLPQWYFTMANAEVRQATLNRVYVSGPLLWAKTAMYRNDATFWKGIYAAP